MDLNRALRSCGFDGDRRDFDDSLVDVLHSLYREWTDEDLLFHPSEATRFCNIVRQRWHLPDLPDEVTLRCLVNIRKRGMGAAP